MRETSDTETAKPAVEARRGDKGATPDHQAPVELRYELLFSAMYHDLCERRFGRWHRGLTACTLVSGSGAAAAFSSEYGAVTPWLALIVAVLSSVQIVWDFGGLSKTHGTLKQKYYTLLGGLERGGDETEIRAEMTTTYGLEPPMRRYLMEKAYAHAKESLYGPPSVKK